MKDKIKQAYDAILPDAETEERMLRTIKARAENTAQSKRPVARRVLLIAACIALLAAVSAAGVAAYLKWSLPEPKTYPSGNGYYDVHTTETYLQEDIPTATAAQEDTSDEAFARKAVDLLQMLGLTDADTSRMTVIRQKHMGWDREEAVVSFSTNAAPTALTLEEQSGYLIGHSDIRITFDAQSGYLIGLSDIQWVYGEGEPVCKTEEEVCELALSLYESLPVPQGYAYYGCTKYDEQFWTYEFCNEPLEGFFNEYEMVRLSINPVSGKLDNLVVFYVPLLDDHEEGDVPLTQAQAEAVLQAAGRAPENMELTGAEVKIVLPNWMFTDKFPTDGDAVASDVTRLAWVLTYESKGVEEFDSKMEFYVDYYTGELLGGDYY